MCRRGRGHRHATAADRAVDRRHSNGRNATPAADQIIGISCSRSDYRHRPATEGARVGRYKWEDASGGGWSLPGAYNDPAGLAARYALGPDTVDVVHAIVGALAKFARCGRRLIQPRDGPRDRALLSKPARCCPAAPQRTRGSTADGRSRTGVDGAAWHSPGGQFCGDPSPFASKLRQSRNPTARRAPAP
jgi:hypothetical protein